MRHGRDESRRESPMVQSRERQPHNQLRIQMMSRNVLSWIQKRPPPTSTKKSVPSKNCLSFSPSVLRSGRNKSFTKSSLLQRFSSKILLLASDWADIFYPRLLIGRICIRVPMPAPSHHREICSKSTRDFCSDSIASRYFNLFGWIQKFSIVSIRNKRYHSTSKVLIYLYWISELFIKF